MILQRDIVRGSFLVILYGQVLGDYVEYVCISMGKC